MASEVAGPGARPHHLEAEQDPGQGPALTAQVLAPWDRKHTREEGTSLRSGKPSLGET